jgi:Tfp pilus assembly pilus retraction ATPase PilT
MNEDMVIIKVSELLKDSDKGGKILNHEIVSTIEAAVQELVGAGKLVEIIQEDRNG